MLSARKAAVAVGAVERAVFADNPYKLQRVGQLAKGRRIAVVGGGVAGLTFASKLYEQGAFVTIFERKKLLSTLWLIPDFRLPRQALKRIEEQAAGKFSVVEQNVDAAKLAELTKQFDVVFLSTGAQKLYTLGVKGEEFSTPFSVFLDSESEFRKKCVNFNGKKIVVIGGGNTAMDCARLAARKGSIVTVAYRRTRSDMPAFDKEAAAAQEEGVQFIYNVAPIAIEKQNSLVLTLAQTESEGRGKLIVTDQVRNMSCDVVVSALGSSFDNSIVDGCNGDIRHSFTNVYIGGDASGGKTVAEAVHDALTEAQKAIESFGR